MLLIHGKTRRGVGSIIGGAFLVLIMIIGYAFYVMSNQSVNEFQSVLSDMRKLDVDREQEHLYIKTVSPSSTGLSADIVNDGPNIINIIYTCYRDISNPIDPYHYTSLSSGVWIDPSTSNFVPINIPGYSSTGLYSVRLISDRGRSYTTSWPVTGLEGGEKTYITGEISDIIGKFLPFYLSFQWAVRTGKSNNLQVSGFNDQWNGNWAISDSGPIIVRIKVTWYGRTTITLGPKTCFYINPMDLSDNKAFYLVYYDEASGTISGYNPTVRPITFNYERTRTLYFAASRADITDLTSDGVTIHSGEHPCSTFLNIYDSFPGVYSQSFPLYALFSTSVPRVTNPITMTVDPLGGGTVSPSSAQWSVGNNYITAHANDGFKFSKWSSPTNNVVFNYPTSYDTIVTYNGVGPATVTANFVPSIVDHLFIESPASVVHDSVFIVTVSARYIGESIITDYAGKIRFSSTDGQAILPTDYTFTPDDNGSHSFLITLKTIGSQTITVTDTATALSKTYSIQVT